MFINDFLNEGAKASIINVTDIPEEGQSNQYNINLIHGFLVFVNDFLNEVTKASIINVTDILEEGQSNQYDINN